MAKAIYSKGCLLSNNGIALTAKSCSAWFESTCLWILSLAASYSWYLKMAFGPYVLNPVN